MQEKERNMEQELWEYIDELCTEADRQRIAELIRTNSKWAAMHKELLAFQQELAESSELQEPHMRFTQNIMDTIAGMQPVPVMRRYINRSLMRGLAAFFIISTGLSLLLILFSTNWSAPMSIANEAWHLPKIDFSPYFNSHSANLGISILVVLLLVFFDQMLRTRRVKHN